MQGAACCKNGSNSKADFEKVIEFIKIISEQNRLKILCFLRENERCVCDIWKELNMSQNLTSHHLKVLKDFGLIDSKCDKEEARKMLYSSDKEAINKYTTLLNSFLFSNI
ncbi:MAG: metalloregulator ArsR/SmtB family transcription factor [Candidatus Lokiarchaeota archaeon]|nr:metalloregulator ArsR/SmtB family transcription factor [Candidatus Lokiarchaeota archaeon]